MQRRTLLKLGLGGTALLTVAGGTAVMLQEKPLHAGKLSLRAQQLFHAVSASVLDGALPVQPPARTAALQSQLYRLDTLLAGLPKTTQGELSQLLALLLTAPGRVLLAGLTTDWAVASIPQVQQCLESMRQSRLAVRQQAYHALRDLTNAAYYADPASWPLLGYPGPMAVGNATTQQSVS